MSIVSMTPRKGWAESSTSAPPRPEVWGMVGESRAFTGTLEYAGRITRSNPQTILIVGEPGTGKKMLARMLHHTRADARGPLLTIDPRTVDARMLQSELFGHERHALPWAHSRREGILEIAGEGTVLIDDIGQMPQALQPKLLRALTQRKVRRLGGKEEFDVRCCIIATANRPLEELVAQGIFRDDLFERLNPIRLSMPPLRDRDHDVVHIARHFMDETVREQGLLPMTLSDDAVRALLAHHWPGNARELRDVIRSAAERCRGDEITREHLSLTTRQLSPMELDGD